ncbi:hypothetical protein CBB_A0054 [Clostridium botulinum Bf]|nr:hypothetical protein CBB_A0033 [Clostridium botulinum Bf]EDT83774.1 hypothetical protein CBB_A0054 [Clostridium botulinum Bf]
MFKIKRNTILKCLLLSFKLIKFFFISDVKSHRINIIYWNRNLNQ